MLIEKLRQAAANQTVPLSLRQMLNEAADEIEGYARSFDLRWNADMRAIKRWRTVHPGNDLVWPDHTELVVWLMEQHVALSSELKSHE